uniref:Uncharacterized protein n=1 Tax=Rhizophora mucronata TaxID=61149 RepID=A0A2P2PXZ3_RHIMU
MIQKLNSQRISSTTNQKHSGMGRSTNGPK